MRRLLVLALFAVSLPLGAQSVAKVVSPGMSRAKVVAALGEPATARSVADFTYLFYLNSCAKVCGMNDLVVLRGDSVVDAIFRSPNRKYTGTSSSPAPISPQQAARPAAAAKPASRLKPSAQANDARPSIPSNTPAVSPAPSTSPATRAP
ncbi:MAG TPA: hypothetical protein VGP25_05835 [Gemmatimonadaceae bacterium]|jgi:hypothetical protein|nr:hypothetical protein [Gemmatimonadaceae bacterium]